jgi:hypothetical protein
LGVVADDILPVVQFGCALLALDREKHWVIDMDSLARWASFHGPQKYGPFPIVSMVNVFPGLARQQRRQQRDWIRVDLGAR